LRVCRPRFLGAPSSCYTRLSLSFFEFPSGGCRQCFPRQAEFSYSRDCLSRPPSAGMIEVLAPCNVTSVSLLPRRLVVNCVSDSVEPLIRPSP
jgi:hypothetical protein